MTFTCLYAMYTLTHTATATYSITVAAPLDVIKTRVQNRPFDSPESGMSVVRNILAHEGPGAFFKGESLILYIYFTYFMYIYIYVYAL
jgi:Mitochondrial carrier protein